MEQDKDEKLLQELIASLDRLDEELEVTPPGMDELRHLVDQVENRKKRKNDLQFVIFVCAASFAVSFGALAYSRMSLLFFAIVQGGALLCFPSVMLIWQTFRKRRLAN